MPEKEGESADVLKRQVAELQQEIKQLMAEKQQKERIVTATKPFATPEKGVERVRAEGGGLVVQFTNDAVALTPDEASKLRTELKALSGSGKIHVDVTVPQGFSEPATVLPVQVFIWSDNVSRGFVEKTSGAIIVLMVFLLAINSLAIYLRNRFEVRW